MLHLPLRLIQEKSLALWPSSSPCFKAHNEIVILPYFYILKKWQFLALHVEWALKMEQAWRAVKSSNNEQNIQFCWHDMGWPDTRFWITIWMMSSSLATTKVKNEIIGVTRSHDTHSSDASHSLQYLHRYSIKALISII